MNQLNLFKVSEIEVSFKPAYKISELPTICSSKDCYNTLLNQWDWKTIDYSESFLIMLLNRANKILGISVVSTGGIAGTIADPKVIFGIALKAGASAIILAHNHPSGNLKPSSADLNLTRKLVEAGKLLDLPILDHLIITSQAYLSFADEGLMDS